MHALAIVLSHYQLIQFLKIYLSTSAVEGIYAYATHTK